MAHEIGLTNLSPMNNGSTASRPSSPPPDGYPTANFPTSMLSIRARNNNALQLPEDRVRNKWFDDMRGWIMVVAVLVASVTYTSGLNPPGGFWQDDLNGHNAGSAILRDKMETRYTTFFYANATAFMASLIIIILLMNENYYTNPAKVVMLDICMELDLISMMIAYAAGCARSLSTSIYVIVLAVAVLLFVIFSSHVLPPICNFAKDCVPGMENIVGRDLFEPVQESERRNTTRA